MSCELNMMWSFLWSFVYCKVLCLILLSSHIRLHREFIKNYLGFLVAKLSIFSDQKFTYQAFIPAIFYNLSHFPLLHLCFFFLFLLPTPIFLWLLWFHQYDVIIPLAIALLRSLANIIIANHRQIKLQIHSFASSLLHFNSFL